MAWPKKDFCLWATGGRGIKVCHKKSAKLSNVFLEVVSRCQREAQDST